MTEYDLIIKCENQLGWTAPRGKTLWKARSAEVQKLKKTMAKAGVTIADVNAALELSRRQHRTIDSPSQLVYRVEEALDKVVDTTPAPEIDAQIQDAIDFELGCELPGYQTWVKRLTRCYGSARVEVFNEWASQRLVEVA